MNRRSEAGSGNNDNITIQQQNEQDALDVLTREWHQGARASDHLTMRVREAAIRPRPSYAAPRYLVPAVASICVLALLGGSIGLSALRPPSAIAAVRRSMQLVRTARWNHQTVTRTIPGGTVLRTVRGTTTIDLVHLAACVEIGPSEVYIRTRSGAYWKRNGLIIADNRPVTQEEVANDLRRRLFPDVRIQGRTGQWRVSEEKLRGALVRHFVLMPLPNAPLSDVGDTSEEFWADQPTNRILATRYSVPRREGKRIVEDVFTTSDYQYDLPVPETVFQAE